MKPADNTVEQTPPAQNPSTDNDIDPALKLLFESVDAEDQKPEENEPKEKPVASLSEFMAKQDSEKSEGSDNKQPQDSKPKPTDDKPKADKPEEAPDGDGALKVRTKKAKVPPPPTPQPAPQAQPQEPKVEPVKQEAKEDDDGDWIDEEKEQIELARLAERVDPERYKGFAAKTVKFLKEHKKYLEDHKDESFDDDNSEYQAWLAKNKVGLSSRERIRIEAADIYSEREKKYREEIDELHHERFRSEEEPKIKKAADDFFGTLVREAIPDELRQKISTDGTEKAKAEMPFEYKIANEYLSAASNDIEEFIKINTVNNRTGRALVTYDEAKHRRLLDMVTAVCNDFETNGGDARVRDGKRFISREEMAGRRLTPEQKAQCWTFSNQEIIQRVVPLVKRAIKDRLDREYAEREAQGWTRKMAQAVAQQQQKQTPAPAAPRPSQIPAKTTQTTDELDPAIRLLMGDQVD